MPWPRWGIWARVASRLDITSGCGETTSYGKHSQSERVSNGAVEWFCMKKDISPCRSFSRRELLAITMTGVSSRSARRAISSPSALPYNPDQWMASVKAVLGLNLCGKARIGQCLHGQDKVIDSILKVAPRSSIQLTKRYSCA